MAVGDLVWLRDLRWDPKLIRVLATISEAEGYDLINGKIFAVPKIAHPPGFLKRLPRRLMSRSELKNVTPQHTERLSLLQLLDQRHNVVTYGTPSAGRESVAVPFSHVMLLTPAAGQFAGGIPPDLCRELELAIESRFGKSIDPGVGVRVGSAASPSLNDGQLLAFLGEGVFVAQDGEQPVGRIRVGPSLDALDEPRVLGDLPAGLYRGQSALAFGSSHAVAPAMIQVGLEDSAWFYLEGSFPATRSDVPLNLSARGNLQPLIVPEAAETDALWRLEFAYDVPDGGLVSTLFVEVIVDARPSRFMRTPSTTRRVFEIAGLRIGEDDIAGGVEAFWIDFGVDGFPIASAMTPRDATIVHDGRRLRRYSWRRYDYDRQAAPDFKIENARSGWIFRRSNDEPLGYLEAPATPQPAVFRADWWTTQGYHVDWLDFVGCVENANRTRGLADVHADRAGIMVPSIATAPDHEFEIGPLILRRRT